MFHLIKEGDAIPNGICVKIASDGGYSLLLRTKNTCFYVRLRGKTNPTKPRILYGKRKIGA